MPLPSNEATSLRRRGQHRAGQMKIMCLYKQKNNLKNTKASNSVTIVLNIFDVFLLYVFNTPVTLILVLSTT